MHIVHIVKYCKYVILYIYVCRLHSSIPSLVERNPLFLTFLHDFRMTLGIYIYIYISSTVLMPVFFCLGLDSVEGEFAWNLRIWGNITIVSCTFFRESVEYRSWNWQIENPQFPIHKRKPFLVNLILTQQFYNIHTYIHTYVYYNILWRFEILVKPGKFFSSYLRFFLN